MIFYQNTWSPDPLFRLFSNGYSFLWFAEALTWHAESRARFRASLTSDDHDWTS